jgi:hypothetical protein
MLSLILVSNSTASRSTPSETPGLNTELRRLDQAMQVLSGLGGTSRARGGKRRLSAAARARIAAAQRARWAKWKKAKQAT